MARSLTTLKSLLDWRQPGGLVSVAGHATLLIVGLAAFSSAKPFTPAQESAAVDVISEREFNEMMKGDKKGEKKPEPALRADRVAEIRKENEPGEAKKDVVAEPAKVEPPKAEVKPEPRPEPRPEPKPLPEPPRQVAALPPPPVRPPELKPVVRPPEPKPQPQDEPEDEKAELPTPPKRPEPKPEPKPEQKREDLAKLLEQKQLEEKRRDEEKRREEAKAAEEARKAEERKKAEDKKRADEKAAAEKAAAEKKAREEREKREKQAAEAKKLEDSIRQRLLTSREAPSSTGATGAQVSRQASLGAETATGRRLSPSERSQLIGLLTEQMNRCLSIPPGAIPRSKPIVALTLARDGSITSGPTLTNPMNEPGYMPYAEANMRALRNCAPFRIPERFAAMYDDWKSLRIGFDPSEMQ